MMFVKGSWWKVTKMKIQGFVPSVMMRLISLVKVMIHTGFDFRLHKRWEHQALIKPQNEAQGLPLCLFLPTGECLRWRGGGHVVVHCVLSELVTVYFGGLQFCICLCVSVLGPEVLPESHEVTVPSLTAWNTLLTSVSEHPHISMRGNWGAHNVLHMEHITNG